MTTPILRSRVRVPDLTALALLAVTVGVAFHPDLPAELIVGWHVTLDGETTLRHAPRILATFAIPVVAVGVYAIARGVAAVPRIREELCEVRWAYDAAVHALLVALCVAQIAIVAVNL